MRGAQLARDVQPERRQLERDARLHLLARDGVERVEVGARGATRVRLIGHALAQIVERRLEPLRVQRLGDDDPVGQLLARYVALRQPVQQIVAHDQPVDRVLIRQKQQRPLEHLSLSASASRADPSPPRAMPG